MATLQRPQHDSPAAIRQALAHAFDMLERYEEWHTLDAAEEPALGNGWAKGSSLAGFRIDPLSNVYLRGVLSASSAPGNGNTTVAFTLPHGYRPLVAVTLPTVGSSGGAFYTGMIEIATSGTVTLTLRGLAAFSAVTDIVLAGTFRVF